MKTAKDFLERLQSDEAFAKEVSEKAKAKAEAGEEDYTAIWKAVGAEYDYELTDEELEEWHKAAAAELSDEELGKTAGGTTPAVVFISTALLSGIASLKASIDSAKEGCI